MDERSSNPYPVPVVRALIADAEDRILILKRAATSHGEGNWCLPGGKVDYGQTIEEALARELAEETGLHLVAAEFFLLQNSLPMRPGAMHCINLYYACRVAGDIRLNSESSDLAWIRPEDLAKYAIMFRNDEAIRRYFEAGEH